MSEKIEVWNILPRNDADKHIENGKCKCHPKIEKTESRILITHNSFDGREILEMANEILRDTK